MADDDSGTTDETSSETTEAAPTTTESTFKAITSQADLDALVDRRLNRERARYADYDDLKAKASQLEVLTKASQTDTERAVAEAQDSAWNAAMATTVPRLVRSEFKAAAKGVLNPDQLSALLEDLDLLRYATDDGEADETKIAKKIAAFATPTETKPRREMPDLGGGKRGATAKTFDMNAAIRQAAGYSD